MSKNRPDAGTLDIPIQRTIFGRGRAACANVVFWTTDVAGPAALHFLDSHLCDLCLGLEIRASRGEPPPGLT